MGTDATLTAIVDDLHRILPVIHKKLLKTDLCSVNPELSRLHFAVMVAIGDRELPLSEIARQMVIPRPQITYLVRQLQALGFIERHPERRDKRITNIALTPAGQNALDKCRQLFRYSITRKLGRLTEEELNELAAVLTKLKIISSKLG